MVQLWMSWCRLCAREDPSKSHINVLLKDEEGLPLADTITQCFSIDINNLNNLPKTICTDCYRLIRTNIILNQRIAKVSIMFAELQVANEEDIDAHTIKARHNLEYDFKLFTISPLEKTTDIAQKGKLSEIEEQPFDQEVGHCNKILDLKTTDFVPTGKLSETEEQLIDHEVGHSNKILDSDPIIIEVEEDETDNFDRVASHGEESFHSNSRKRDQKDTEKMKKKYKSRKEKRAKNNTKPHYCSECHKGFIKLHNYREHMQGAHDIIIELEPPLFICENCGKEYKCISALKEHKRSHTDERKLKCKYCEKTFKGPPSLKAHEDTHNKTNYICVVCGLQLNTQHTLRSHMVVHSDQKKHKCDCCGNQFKRAKDLKNHLILHTGLKPYSCDFCDRTFASGSNCRSHKKKNHPVELAAQEAAGKKSISKVRIPKLGELKAATASKATMDKPYYPDKHASLEPIPQHNSSFTLGFQTANGSSAVRGRYGQTELLIEAVKQRPGLWNIRNEEYRNRVIWNNLWEEVLSELNLDDDFKTKVQKRWDTLKTGYGRSKKDPSGSGAKPTYKYAPLLVFLDDTREPRCTTSLMMSDTPPAPSLEKPSSKKKNATMEHQQFQIEALQILKDINSPKPPETNIQNQKTFAALTCELIQKDMETLPDLEQRSLRTQLFTVVDDAVRRHRSGGQ